MILNMNDFSASQVYHLMTQAVIPRPIAWILTQNEDGESHNLAPFSYFNVMCSDPALVVFSISQKEKNIVKDTTKNILREKSFVVQIPCFDQKQSVVNSSKSLAYGESELSIIDESLVKFGNGYRLSNSSIAMLCDLYDTQKIGTHQQQTIIWGQVNQLYVQDDMVTNDDKRINIHASKVDPLARLGAGFFGKITEIK